MSIDLARLALKELLGSADVKAKVFAALEYEAKKTDTEIDDDIVAAFKAVYDVVVPVIVGEIP